MKKYILLSLTILACSQTIYAQTEDPYLWLEEVDSKKALEFAEQQSKNTLERLIQQKEYQNIFNKSLEIYNSTARIAYPTLYNDFIYNFWQDKDHERGIWRRTAKANYINGNPDWEILLDIDEMTRKDTIKWVYKGANGLYPKYDRFLVSLSKGGADAVVTREFDVNKKSFVENGFYMEESKGESSYLDENTLIVSTDFGAGTMTSSGYPKQVKLWKRGTLLKDAQLIYECDSTDVGSYGYVMRDGSRSYLMAGKYISLFVKHTFVWTDKKLVKLDIPDDCQNSALLNNQLILDLKSDWTVNGKIYKQGSIVSLNFTSLLKGQKEIQLVVQPDEFTSVSGVSSTKNKLLINLLTNVKNELYIYSFDNVKWERKKVNAPDLGTILISSTDEFSDQYFFDFTNFLTPSTLYIANAHDNSLKPLKSLPAYFDASKYKVAQYKAKSTDGTMVPFFVVSSASMEYNGKNPTLLYAYGGFEVSILPIYSGIIGNAWLENGGVYVLANIRGGGEYGPQMAPGWVERKKAKHV